MQASSAVSSFFIWSSFSIVNFENVEIIVICDSGSESENGDGIEMLRVMPTDIADLEHGAAAFNS